MKTVNEMTSLDLVTTQMLFDEIDKRADRAIIIMEKNKMDKTGVDTLIHNSANFASANHVLATLAHSANILVKNHFGDFNNGS